MAKDMQSEMETGFIVYDSGFRLRGAGVSPKGGPQGTCRDYKEISGVPVETGMI